jgi:hypothetical protein
MDDNGTISNSPILTIQGVGGEDKEKTPTYPPHPSIYPDNTDLRQHKLLSYCIMFNQVYYFEILNSPHVCIKYTKKVSIDKYI